MRFEWPLALLALVIVPLAVLIYRRVIARNSGESLAVHPDGQVLELASARMPFWARHAPAVLVGLSLGLGLFALARPQAVVPVPDDRTSVMLALDVSRSMMAQDVLPTRFEAAKAALKTFVRSLPPDSRVGLVTFARYATLNHPLSTDHDRLIEVVDALDLDFGTVIGDGLQASLDALPSAEQYANTATSPNLSPNGRSGQPSPASAPPEVVVLLSDGRNFGGADPLEVADVAKARRIVVHTVGVGTISDGPIPGLPPQVWPYARFDEATLKGIAAHAGGTYNFVDNAGKLDRVYRDLARVIGWKTGWTEITALLTLISAGLLGSSLIVSSFSRRIV